MNINCNPAFSRTRRTIARIEHIETSQQLLAYGWDNVDAYNSNQPTKEHHVHYINKNDIALTVIITKKNKLFLRGVEYTKLHELFTAGDKVRN